MIYYVKTNFIKTMLQLKFSKFFLEILQRDIYWTLDMLELGWRVRSYA